MQAGPRRRGGNPSLAAPGLERCREGSAEPQRGGAHLQRAAAGEPVEAGRAGQARLQRIGRNRPEGPWTRYLAAAELQPRRGRGHVPLESAGEIPLAGHGRRDPAGRRVETHRRVGDVDVLVGQAERRAGGRREQLVDLSETHLAARDPAVKADAARDDQRDARPPKAPAQPQLDIAGGEVRVRGIAEDEILDRLPPETEMLDAVRRPHAPPGKLAIDIVGGDVLALQPQDEDRHGEKRGEREQQRTDPPPPPHKHLALVVHRS